MKKWLVLFVALALVFAVVGCRADDVSDELRVGMVTDAGTQSPAWG